MFRTEWFLSNLFGQKTAYRAKRWTNGGYEGSGRGRGTEKGGAEEGRGGKEQLIDLARVHFPSLNSKRNKLGQLEGKSEERASGDMGRKKEREGRGQGGKEEEEEMFAPRHISCVIALCNETRVFVLAYNPLLSP